MRVLVLCDDYYHPARTPRAGLELLQSGGSWSFDYIEDAHQWSAKKMAGYPLVILTKSNDFSSQERTKWMDDATQAAFVDYVEKGGGLLAVHSGTAGYQETSQLRALLGGVFLRHPEQCPVTVTPRSEHPITSRFKAFTAKDEHYFMALDDQKADVFLSTVSDSGEEPGGWTRSQGQGRVCVLTPGHNVEVWQQPEFQALLDSALHWCAKK